MRNQAARIPPESSTPRPHASPGAPRAAEGWGRALLALRKPGIRIAKRGELHGAVVASSPCGVVQRVPDGVVLLDFNFIAGGQGVALAERLVMLIP